MSSYEAVPAILGYPDRAIQNVKVRYERPIGSLECTRLKRSTRYTVSELNELLDGTQAIWGFDPVTGRAELVRLSEIENAAKRYPERKGTISFKFDNEEECGSELHLIPSITIWVPTIPQYL